LYSNNNQVSTIMYTILSSSHRLDLLYLNSRQDIYLVIIHCYAPTENKNEDTEDHIYEDLETVFNSLLLHCSKYSSRGFRCEC